MKFDANTATGYQKGGNIVNGNVDAMITDNIVDGIAPSPFIARNGIQLGFAAAGVLIGGPFFIHSPCSVGSQVDQNTIIENDVGVWVVQLDTSGSAPAIMTSIKVVHNTITRAGFTNLYQAGVSDTGNNDKVVASRISGAGYDPSFLGRFEVDADPSLRIAPRSTLISNPQRP